MSDLEFKLDTTELDRIIRDADVNADKIVRYLAFKGEGYAKELAPYDTTALRNSIYTVTHEEDHYREADSNAKSKRKDVITEPHPAPEKGEARFGPCVSYASYQEFGTSKMSAHPYMTPAIERLRKEMQDGTTYREMVDPSIGADNDWLI